MPDHDLFHKEPATDEEKKENELIRANMRRMCGGLFLFILFVAYIVTMDCLHIGNFLIILFFMGYLTFILLLSQIG